MVPLVLALYGHPGAGGYWEEQCDKAVTSCGFENLKDRGWRSTYWHPKERALLVVYVDDFNLSAPAQAQDRLWVALSKQLKLEPPTAPDRFLCCYKRPFTANACDVASVLGLKPELYPRTGKREEVLKPQPLTTIKGYNPRTQCRGYVYDMAEYVQNMWNGISEILIRPK